MLDTWPGLIGALAVFLACGLALLKGDRMEQWGGGICFLAWLASVLVQDTTAYAEQQRIFFVGVDVAVLAGLGWVAWRSERSWPTWACACQAITVAVHLAKALDFRIPTAAYYSALVLSSYGVLVALAVGSFIAWREREALKPKA